MGRAKKAKPFRFLVRDRASSGQLRLYYREPGKPRIRINVGEDHPDFASHFAAAKAGTPLPAPGADAPVASSVVAGTLEAVVRDYGKSAAFLAIREAGRKPVLAILESCCAEIWPENKRPMGQIPIKRIADRHVQFLQDQKAGLPGAANNRIKYLRIVFNWAKVRPNPALEIKMLPPVRKDGHHAWTLREIAKFEKQHPIGTNARLAFDLALYTAARRADIVKLGPDNVFIEDGAAWLSFKQGKTGGEVEMPIIEKLAESIAATANLDKATFLVTRFGKPYVASGFGNAFHDWCVEAGLKGCGIHGLRKSAAAKLAELGCSEREIQAITGHATSDEIQRYTRSASQRRMAKSAIDRLRKSLEHTPSKAKKGGGKGTKKSQAFEEACDKS